MKNVVAKMLYDTDLHRKYTDPDSIKGYIAVNDRIFVDRMDFVRDNSITHYLHGGDLYDRGYHDTGRNTSDGNLDRAMSALVNFNAYLNVGNHFFIERDSNPEFYLIQPHERYKPIKPFVAFHPVYKVVDKLKIGTVQISFMHYNKEELYFPTRDADTTFHIALYHTDKVLPKSFRVEAGYFGEVSSEYLKAVYNGVDLALLAHVHVPLGVRKVNDTTLVIPGSSMVTANDAREKHRSVELPVITIYDDNSVEVSMHEFSTHMDKLKFYNKAEKNLLPLNGEKSSRLSEIKLEIQQSKSATSLDEFLVEKGYTQNYINLVDRAAMGTIDYNQARNILAGGHI